jgi:hypothetical protein
MIIGCIALSVFSARAEDDMKSFVREFRDEQAKIKREQQDYNDAFWKASVDYVRQEDGKRPLYSDDEY